MHQPTHIIHSHFRTQKRTFINKHTHTYIDTANDYFHLLRPVCIEMSVRYFSALKVTTFNKHWAVNTTTVLSCKCLWMDCSFSMLSLSDNKMRNGTVILFDFILVNDCIHFASKAKISFWAWKKTHHYEGKLGLNNANVGKWMHHQETNPSQSPWNVILHQNGTASHNILSTDEYKVYLKMQLRLLPHWALFSGCWRINKIK